jgi:hypothetical protein
MQPGYRFFGRIPASLQTGLRWYAAFFLSAFVLVVAIVMPAMSLSWLQ